MVEHCWNWLMVGEGGWPIVDLGTDHVISGPMRGLEIVYIGRGQHTTHIPRTLWLIDWIGLEPIQWKIDFLIETKLVQIKPETTLGSTCRLQSTGLPCLVFTELAFPAWPLHLWGILITEGRIRQKPRIVTKKTTTLCVVLCCVEGWQLAATNTAEFNVRYQAIVVFAFRYIDFH